ncbi:MAG: Hsp33 family molecular chaperone HslO [Mariprofundus sp.]|nr:Hsp33 family molecular chaperone HslO [Mariprofundus sp.]
MATKTDRLTPPDNIVPDETGCEPTYSAQTDSTQPDSDKTVSDQLIRFLLPDARARGVLIRATHIFEEANRIHGLNGNIAHLFDQSLLASILLLSISKGGTRQVLQLNSTTSAAPVQMLLTEARQGDVRGFINWADGQTILHHDDGETLSGWLGKPVRFSTVRDLGFGQPYVSSIEHESDFLADHLIHYLHQSVQIRADIVLHGDLAIMIEAMPGCSDDDWFKAVESMAKIPNSVLETASTASILTYFNDLKIKQAGTDAYRYHCDCSPEKITQAMKNFSPEQLTSLADEAGNITASCQYCRSHHIIKLTQIVA